MEKPFWRSKTLWFNVVFLILTVAGVFGYAEFQPGEDMEQIASIIILVANLILRIVTKEKLTVR